MCHSLPCRGGPRARVRNSARDRGLGRRRTEVRHVLRRVFLSRDRRGTRQRAWVPEPLHLRSDSPLASGLPATSRPWVSILADGSQLGFRPQRPRWNDDVHSHLAARATSDDERPRLDGSYLRGAPAEPDSVYGARSFGVGVHGGVLTARDLGHSGPGTTARGQGRCLGLSEWGSRRSFALKALFCSWCWRSLRPGAVAYEPPPFSA